MRGRTSLFSYPRTHECSPQDFRFPLGNRKLLRGFLQRKPMRIENLYNSNTVEPGQRLVVLKCWKFYGTAAFYHLQQSVKSGLLQFYRHRWEPVPWINRVKHGRLLRHPRTTNERRAHFSNKATKEILESHGVALKVRQKRNPYKLPNAYDDLFIRYQRSWKEHRGTQRKNASSVHRGVHSPAFWA
jgi:hypothetical protein